MDETHQNAVRSLTQLLDRIEQAADQEDDKKITLDMIMEKVGRRSFGALLLLAGIVTLAPLIGDIPGMPTLMGILVFTISLQMLLVRDHLWLPRWMLNRSVSQSKLKKGVSLMRKPARWMDKPLRSRLEVFVSPVGTYTIAICCILVAMMMPVMEVIPFSANLAGITLTAFGLALLAQDGLMALIAFLAVATAVGTILYNLL